MCCFRILSCSCFFQEALFRNVGGEFISAALQPALWLLAAGPGRERPGGSPQHLPLQLTALRARPARSHRLPVAASKLFILRSLGFLRRSLSFWHTRSDWKRRQRMCRLAARLRRTARSERPQPCPPTLCYVSCCGRVVLIVAFWGARLTQDVLSGESDCCPRDTALSRVTGQPAFHHYIAPPSLIFVFNRRCSLHPY